jgi:hypothetical protein
VDGGLVAIGFAAVVLIGGAFGVRRQLRLSRERQAHLASVHRKCEKCGHPVQSEQSRKSGVLEGVVGRERVRLEDGTIKLVPKTFNLCDRCARAPR